MLYFRFSVLTWAPTLCGLRCSCCVTEEGLDCRDLSGVTSLLFIIHYCLSVCSSCVSVHREQDHTGSRGSHTVLSLKWLFFRRSSHVLILCACMPFVIFGVIALVSYVKNVYWCVKDLCLSMMLHNHFAKDVDFKVRRSDAEDSLIVVYLWIKGLGFPSS